MDALRVARLARTVERAARHSPFYRELFGPDLVVPARIEDLSALPVTSKTDIRDSGLERAVPATWYSRRGTWGTSGSSGEPYTFQIDDGYGARHAAQRAFVYLQAGLRPGSRVVEVLPGTRRQPRRDRAYPTFRRTFLGYAGGGLPEAVFAAQPQLLYGNRSHLLQIADWLESTDHTPRLELVCSSSEMLHPEDEFRLERVFRAPVIEVYGSAEASNLGFRLAGQSTWQLLEPRVIVEVLDEARLPASPGEIGELVVTTLTEPTSPLIRYATGDLARVQSGPANGGSGLRLAALEGRSADSLVDRGGGLVPFWSIASSLFWASHDIARHVLRWQVHQRSDRSLVVSLEMTPTGDVGHVASDIERHLAGVLGALPVTVLTTDRIHDPRAGKFRAVTSDAAGR
jgi:phenylacetate-CoA ligase